MVSRPTTVVASESIDLDHSEYWIPLREKIDLSHTTIYAFYGAHSTIRIEIGTHPRDLIRRVIHFELLLIKVVFLFLLVHIRLNR